MDAAAAPFDHEAFLKYFDRRVYKFSACSCFSFLFYLPFGIVLMMVRGIILLGLVVLFNIFPCLNKNSYLVRFTSISLGIHTTLKREQAANEHQHQHQTDSQHLLNIYAANHISSFDYVAIKSMLSEVNHFISDSSSKARVYQPERGAGGGGGGGPAANLIDLVSSRVVNILKSKSLKDDEDNLENHDNYPLMCFPEVIPTNGKFGLLKFDTFVFDLDSFQPEPTTRIAITPVCLQMRRPLLAFNNNYFKSNDLYDVLITMFAPLTVYEITFLKPELKRGDETSEEFADRIQRTIAASLGLKSSEMTYDEMRQMCSSYLRHRQAQLERLAASRQAAVDADTHRRPSVHMTDLSQVRSLSIDKLALQVKEILPYVSYATIQRHIGNSATLDIDTIIASILDSNQEDAECTFTLDSSSSSSSLLLLRDSKSASKLSPSSPSDRLLIPSKSAQSFSPSSSSSMTPSTSTAASRLGSSGSLPSASTATTTKKSPTNAYLSYDERKFNLINEARQRYLAKHPEHYSQTSSSSGLF